MIIKLLFSLVFLCLVSNITAQNQCQSPSIVFNKNAKNIFSEQQEMYLGDVMAETMEKNFRVVKDPEANRYLREVGEKLVKHLPPTNLKFQFYVVDSPELNAFNTAGGRIYVTRKMIAFLRDESELAGILGHELGHGIVRHSAIDMSKYFKEILGVESVGDKNDIFEKFNQLIDKQNTKQVSIKKSHEGEQQLEADKIGLFAMIAAGYDPRGFTSSWERLTESKKTGSAVSEFFGTTRPEEKRLREMLKAISTIPSECLDKKFSQNENFGKWQSFIVTAASFQKEEKLKSIIAKNSLAPYLRADVRHFQFSPDGNYILAQDSSGINVLKKEPFSFVFRLNVDEAKPAKFTPDSKHIVFETLDLRVEKWNVETKKPILAREVYVRGSCWQSALSPDGKYLVCYSGSANLEIIDVETNETILKKEKFYIPSYMEYITWSFMLSENDEKEISALQMEFSPDGKYFLGGRVFRFDRGGSSSVAGLFMVEWGINADQDAFIAYDLQEKKELKLGGDLKNIVARPFAFYSNDKIIGQHRKDPEKSGIFNFPSGERVEKFYLNADSYSTPHRGDYLFVRPTATNPVGAYDLKTKKFFVSNKTAALDGYENYFISEGNDGIVDLVKIDQSNKKIESLGSLTLPKSNFGDVKTISLAPDFSWLALSEKSRGAVWNLSTGEMKIYIRGFRGSFFDTDGSVYADFPSYEGAERAMGKMNPISKNINLLESVKTLNTKQYGKFLVSLKTKQDEKLSKQRDNKGNAPAVNEDEKTIKKPTFTFDSGFLTGVDFDGASWQEGTLEVYDAKSRKMLWSKIFADEVPKYQFETTGETVSLYWKVSTKAAKNELKNKPELAQKLKTLGEKTGDYLVEVLDAKTGNLLGETFIESGEGSFNIKKIFANGDWLTIIDSENRVLLYSLSQDKLVWRFFGDNAAINPNRGIAVVENVPGQLSIYNLKSGQKTDEILLRTPVAHTVFSQDGAKLFVLGSDQNYYIFKTDGFTT